MTTAGAPTVGTFFAEPRRRLIDGRDVEWFEPTDHARGPWDVDACHAGPPTGLLARAMEQALPDVRLTRITVDLAKPVPMAGFFVLAEVARRGRTVAATRASIVDAAGVVRATAVGLHLVRSDVPVVDTSLDNSGIVTPRLADSTPGPFPIAGIRHGRPGFIDAVQMRFPDGDLGAASTTAWMRTSPLLPGEAPSPFQRICPLADCGNAFGRHRDPSEMSFVNADLTVALHRDPVGEWLGSQAVGYWEPDGIGLADALLFDDRGPVGRALQTLVLRPISPDVA